MLNYAWGENLYGELGLGPGGDRAQNSPQQIKTEAFQGKQIIALSAGIYYSLAIAADGSVFVWGRKDHGQLGLGPCGDQNSPQQIKTEAFKNQKIIALSAGDNHSLALAADGSVFVWGKNTFGRLGLGSGGDQNTPQQINTEAFKNQKIIAISAGDAHSLAIAADGSVFVWGYNCFGQLGRGPCRNQNTPRKLSLSLLNSQNRGQNRGQVPTSTPGKCLIQ